MEKHKEYFKISEVCYRKSSKLLSLNVLSSVNVEIDLCKAEFEGDIKKVLDLDVDYEFNYTSPIDTEQYCRERIAGFFKDEYDYDLNDNEIVMNFGESETDLKIFISGTFYLRTKLLGVEESLLSCLNDFSFRVFKLELIPKIENTPIGSKIYDLSSLAEDREKMLAEGVGEYEIVQKDFTISGLDIIVGKSFTDKAMCLNQIKGEMEVVQVAGKIRYFTERSFKKLVEKDGEQIEQERIYYTFELFDGFGKIRVSYFPTKQYLEGEKRLEDGQVVTICGKVEIYRDNPALKAKEFAYCCLPEGQIKEWVKPEKTVDVTEEEAEIVRTPINYKTESENYVTVFPHEYIEENQMDLFTAFEKKEEVCSMLKDKDYVVFDLETTGLDYKTNEILEIGAVKIRNGEIIETFNVLIKPKYTRISEFITKLTGIDDEMVKDAPYFEDVVGDFFKFTRNSTMVAHNSDFDTLFLDFHAGKFLYKFDNMVMDTLAMAKKLVGGIKNYKLITIAKHFNIPLDHAHRALYDTIATAKCFIELCKLDSAKC